MKKLMISGHGWFCRIRWWALMWEVMTIGIQSRKWHLSHRTQVICQNDWFTPPSIVSDLCDNKEALHWVGWQASHVHLTDRCVCRLARNWRNPTACERQGSTECNCTDSRSALRGTAQPHSTVKMLFDPIYSVNAKTSISFTVKLCSPVKTL
jgi:hypothetical protein